MYGQGYGSGYPPQGGGGYPGAPGGYPPAGGYPGGGPPPGAYGAPSPYGAPPPGGRPGGPPGTVVHQQTTTVVTSSAGPPPSSFNNSWFSSYYNQIQQQEMYEIQAWFRSVDRDGSGSITANEIAGITFNGVPLGMDVSTKLVRVFDRDGNRSIDFYEYAAMHKFLASLQAAFFAADRDRSGTIDAREIYNALAGAGFQVSLPVVQSFMMVHNKTGYGVNFHQFLLICATIAQGRSLFQWRDTQRSGRITVTLDQLLELVAQMS